MVAGIPGKRWERIFSHSCDMLPHGEAKMILRLRISKDRQNRAERLGELAQDGNLSAAQRRELEACIRVGHVLALMKSQARQAIRRR